MDPGNETGTLYILGQCATKVSINVNNADKIKKQMLVFAFYLFSEKELFWNCVDSADSSGYWMGFDRLSSLFTNRYITAVRYL